MVASPVPDELINSLAKRLADLERKLDNIANKSLYSAVIGAGGLTVNNNGTVTVTGSGGQKIVISVTGSGPEVDWYPDATGAKVRMLAAPGTDPFGNAIAELRTSSFNSLGVETGGVFREWASGVAMGIQIGGTEGFLYVDNNGNLQWKGGFAFNQAWSGRAAIWCKDDAWGAGAGTFSTSFSATMATVPFGLVSDTIVGGTGNAQSYLTAESTAAVNGVLVGTGSHNTRTWAVRHN